jgi:DNA-binding response OmpR family regulator
MGKILLLEDDLLFGETLVDFLELESFDVEWIRDGYECENVCYENRFDLLILDINVPNIDGISILVGIRKKRDRTPVMFLTSYRDKSTMIRGFETGCDDFLKKPVDLDELLVRINALLKRTLLESSTYMLGDVIYDFSNKRLNSCQLSIKQYKLLELLIRNRNKITTKQMIYDELWSWDQTPSDGSLRVYINELKKLLGRDSIKNCKALGYRLEI